METHSLIPRKVRNSSFADERENESTWEEIILSSIISTYTTAHADHLLSKHTI